MAYRYTNTEKWKDAWFCNLTQIQMLFFIYLCDNCDIAGFIEVNQKRWASDLGSSVETIQGALVGLQRGLLLSNDGECLFIVNFLKHQKNLPLDPDRNPAHKGIIRRFNIYCHKFDNQNNIWLESNNNVGLTRMRLNESYKAFFEKVKMKDERVKVKIEERSRDNNKKEEKKKNEDTGDAVQMELPL